MLQALVRTLASISTALAFPAIYCGQALARPQAAPVLPPAAQVPAVHVLPPPPASTDVAIIQGVNTGTVRVSNLANLEAILNWVVNGIEIGGVVWGLLCIYQGIRYPARRVSRIALGLFLIATGLVAPLMFNFFFLARDCGAFFD